VPESPHCQTFRSAAVFETFADTRPGSNLAVAFDAKEGAMVRSVVFGLILLGVASVASAQDAKAKGEQVFAAQKCSLCHSVAGKGNPKGSLDDVGTKLKGDEIRQWLVDAKGMTAKAQATRKPEMKAYSLPKEDVDALVAYLSSLKK
jgi:mono/diheme cytochrome c family protein